MTCFLVISEGKGDIQAVAELDLGVLADVDAALQLEVDPVSGSERPDEPVTFDRIRVKDCPSFESRNGQVLASKNIFQIGIRSRQLILMSTKMLVRAK